MQDMMKKMEKEKKPPSAMKRMRKKGIKGKKMPMAEKKGGYLYG